MLLTLASLLALAQPIVLDSAPGVPTAAVDALVAELVEKRLDTVIRADAITAPTCASDAACKAKSFAARLVALSVVDGKLRIAHADGTIDVALADPAAAGKEAAARLPPATALLSNIKAVRVPGAAAGARTVAGKVTVQPRRSEVVGTLPKEAVQKVINQHIGEIQYCYEKALREQEGLAGRVVLRWTVTPKGIVQDQAAKEAPEAMAGPVACMLGKIRHWRFPEAASSTTIAYPFVFNAV